MESSVAAQLRPSVERAARIVARKWPNVVNADDIEQEIWTTLLESPGSALKLVSMDPDKRDNGLEVIGHQRAALERDDHAVFSGNVYYGTKEVRALLGSIRNGGEVRSFSGRMDVEVAMEELNDQQKRVIYANYWLGDPVHTHPETLGRAVDRLTVLMNRIHRTHRYDREGGPGSRKAVSNARAEALSSIEYTGYDAIKTGLGNG